MAAFDVTPEELIQSGQQLKAIAQDLQSAHHRVESLRSAQVGSYRIDSALNHFADHWQHGMRRLVERVDMTDEANRLRRFAHRDDWRGEAADVFAEQLDTLPRDLQHCGDTFSDLALALGNYHQTFTLAKAKAAELEHRAVKARESLHAIETAFNAPVIQAPDTCSTTADRSTLEAAEDDLGAVLREAHDFAGTFDDSPEVQQIAAAIRSFTEFAPDAPGWSLIRRWAGNVFSVTPIGAFHSLIDEYAEFFSELADLMSDVSGFLGLLSLPLVFVPPIGTAVGVAAFGLAAGSAAIKTSLYAGHARDANGKLYVGAGELFAAVGDAGLGAAGLGVAARAEQALAKGMNAPKAFGRAFAEQFHADTFRDATGAARDYSEMLNTSGPKNLGRHL